MMEQNGAKMDFMYRLVSKESIECQRRTLICFAQRGPEVLRAE